MSRVREKTYTCFQIEKIKTSSHSAKQQGFERLRDGI